MKIDDIANLKMVEELVNNTSKGHSENKTNLQDLCQDIYEILLLKRKEIEPLSKKDTKYYISRIVSNNILSKTSRYYYRYKKNKHLPIEAWASEETTNNNKNNNDV